MMRHREHEQLAAEADFACAVLGNSPEFLLVPLSEDDERAGQMCEECARRGFRYAGILAMVRGQAASQYVDADSIETIVAASYAFAQLAACHIRAQADFVDFASRLWELPDERAN